MANLFGLYLLGRRGLIEASWVRPGRAGFGSRARWTVIIG